MSQNPLQKFFEQYAKPLMESKTQDPIPNMEGSLRKRDPSVYTEDGAPCMSSTSNCNVTKPLPVLTLEPQNTNHKKMTTLQTVCVVFIVALYGIATIVAAAGTWYSIKIKKGCEVKYWG